MYKNMIDYFKETVQRDPEKTAVVHHDTSLTFAQLDRRCRLLAGIILEKMSPDALCPVSVFLPKSIDIVVADIAITYSANFFSNLDIKTPIERISGTLGVLKPGLLITNTQHMKLLGDLTKLGVPVLNLDEIDWEQEPTQGALIEKRLSQRIDTDPFCIINTSGSTGIPKGVILNHRSFFDYLRWAIERFHLDGTEIMGSLVPVVFDAYKFELCLLMMKGARLVVLDAMLAAFPVKLLEEVNRQKVNFIFWVPTIMVNIANMKLLDTISLSALNRVWFIGEVFPTRQFNVWRRHLPQAEFVNLYGPIEITVSCTYHVFDGEVDESQSLPVGRPCKNTDILLLNDEDALCAVGEMGEVCVRGTSLAMGYYNNPEKTAAAFVQNPLNHSYPELIYRTGDMAYWNEDGLLMFKGRKDSLIKHMGYRIELGEIEHVIVNKLKLVKNCCAVYNFADKEIVLFYEKKNDVSDLDIRKALGNEFPRYMIPRVYTVVEELPRNINGKIDRFKLRQQVNKE